AATPPIRARSTPSSPTHYRHTAIETRLPFPQAPTHLPNLCTSPRPPSTALRERYPRLDAYRRSFGTAVPPQRSRPRQTLLSPAQTRFAAGIHPREESPQNDIAR